MKVPLAFCANEDCVYKKETRCPAGELKNKCPNKSIMDYKKGCDWYYGKPYQYFVLKDSMNGMKPVHVNVTGRGTGKSAVMDTQKVVMEATTEPYIKGMFFGCDSPVPTKIIVVGNTKDTSLLLRRSIHNVIEGNELLNDFIIENTKTYIRTNSNAEIWFKTAGVDGRGIRGFHADIVHNTKNEDVKCTIIIIFDEAAFTRARSVIQEVMRPSLQMGNIFSQIFITTTPYSTEGEVYDLASNPGDEVFVKHFASYNNKFSNIKLLYEFKKRCIKAGLGTIWNREILGLFESEIGLFFPWFVWSMSIDDSLDFRFFEDIEKSKDEGRIPGRHYLSVDPNQFRQLAKGDFATWVLHTVSGDRRHVRATAYGKDRFDSEESFLDKIKLIYEVYRPVVSCDENSGFVAKLKAKGIPVRNAKNDRNTLLKALKLVKFDMADGIYKQPSSQDWEDERRFFVPKEDGMVIPLLSHDGNWGEGKNDDLMKCLSYNYQAIMEDFGLDNIATDSVAAGIVSGSNENRRTIVKPSGRFTQFVTSSRNRMDRIK